MWSDIFINLTILTSFIFVGGQFFKNKSFYGRLLLKDKLMVGIFTGVLGIVLMEYGVKVQDLVFDLRYLAIILAAMSGGPISALLSATIIGIMRICLFGMSDHAIIACFTAIFVGIGCAIIVRTSISIGKKWIYLNVCILLLSFVFLLYTVNNIYIYVIYLGINIIAGYIIFFSANYVHESNEMYRSVKKQATVDFLTGLQNVRQFDFLLHYYVEKSVERGNSLSLLLLDIDHFKKVNDTYGHTAGDEVLKQIAAIFQQQSSVPDLVFRKGGEEFTILLPNSGLSKAIEVGERIRSAVEKHSFVLTDGTKLVVTISIGASMYIHSIDEFVEAADHALYHAKHLGRNRISMM
ncbi:diguanylate cyclase [Microbacteriaceae bacterium 4G12]